MRTAMLHGSQARPNTYHHDQGFGELFVAGTGITYSDPRIGAHFAARGGAGDYSVTRPWLESEAKHVKGLVDSNPVTLVAGDYGAGKSTVLFGVRTLLRQEEEPYMVVNGHHLSHARRISEAIGKARTNGWTVLYDSFDYLFMRNSRRREAKHARPLILEALGYYVSDGGRMVATLHTQPWLDGHSNPGLIGELDSFAETTGAECYRVHGYMSDDDELRRLCGDVVDPEYASLYPLYASASAERTARTYRVVKVLGKRIGATGLLGMTQAAFDDHVRALDAADRALVKAPADYSFLPAELAA